jgi:hypothetical protein
MKTELITKTRHTKFKLKILLVLIILSIFTYLLNYYEVVGQELMRYSLTTYFLIFIGTSWFKNYKVSGHLSLGEKAIKIYENGQLIKEFDYQANKVKSVTIKWQAFSNDIVRIFNGFLYLDSWNDSVEIVTETDFFSFDIIMDQFGNERKSVDWIFNKLEEKGIKTGYDRKIENQRPTRYKSNAARFKL